MIRAWIIHNQSGYEIFQKWPNSGERSKIFFEGPVPRNVLAVVHTHPAHKDSKPSTVDVSFGKRVKIDVYVISADGLWMSNVDGKISRVMRYTDFKGALSNCEEGISKETKPRTFWRWIFSFGLMSLAL